MVEEDYVSFETAKLLKERGFDEKCSHYWQDEISEYSITKEIHRWTDSTLANTEISTSKRFSAPTLQMVMKWLREVHNIHISIATVCDGKAWGYETIIQKQRIPVPATLFIDWKDTSEEACEAAIRYCLENLI